MVTGAQTAPLSVVSGDTGEQLRSGEMRSVDVQTSLCGETLLQDACRVAAEQYQSRISTLENKLLWVLEYAPRRAPHARASIVYSNTL